MMPFLLLKTTRSFPVSHTVASSKPPRTSATFVPSDNSLCTVALSALEIFRLSVSYTSLKMRKIGLPFRKKSSIKKAILADLFTNFESNRPLTVNPRHVAPCGWKANTLFSGFISSRRPRSSQRAKNCLKPWPSIQGKNPGQDGIRRSKITDEATMKTETPKARPQGPEAALKRVMASQKPDRYCQRGNLNINRYEGTTRKHMYSILIRKIAVQTTSKTGPEIHEPITITVGSKPLGHFSRSPMAPQRSRTLQNHST
mmetsp:Transcript_57404/g.134403  ORF Transcript_57404/g.134403 Transcript_57404/m.134403 type:complete len:257 (-) Transcript_57404:22-792(-)